ncbi:MAG: RNA polymerase sigma factor [Candidatus Coatesbacteria bacterium]|nr:MAG: RNA polymerase sigma factor [Candidatus Coatesbacteria bacterium]
MAGSASKERSKQRLTRDEEAALIQRTLAGDDDAFAEIVKAFNERLYALAVGVLRNGTAAEDVVQESFIKAYRNLAKFRQESSIYTWLYRITVNTAHNYIRKNVRNGAVDMEEVAPIIADPSPNPVQTAAGNELAEAVAEVVKTLPERQRQVFELHFFEHLTHREIGEMLEITEGAVKANYFHAIKKMQKALSPFLVEYEV